MVPLRQLVRYEGCSRFVIIFNCHSLFFFFFLSLVIPGSRSTFLVTTNCARTFVCLRQTFPLKRPAVRDSWPHPSVCQSLEHISSPGAHSTKRTQFGGVPCTALGFFDHFKVNDVILSTHACSKPEHLASGIRSCASKRYRKGWSNTITFLQLCYDLFSRKF